MFKRTMLALTSAMVFLFSGALIAQDDDDQLWNRDFIERAVLTSEVVNREPVDDLGHEYDLSGADYDRVSLFTHMINHANRGITHQWYHRGELQAEVNLQVGSNNWRTYSTKQIHHMATGDWFVRVINDDGEQLLEYHFTVSPQT